MDRRAALGGRPGRVGAHVHLRVAEADDALSLGALLRRCLSDAPSAIYEEDEVARTADALGRDMLRVARIEGHLLLLGELGAMAVSVGQVAPREFVRARHVAALGILVDPAWRGRGVGEATLRGLLRRGFGFDRGLERVEVRIADDDLALRTLAARCGFAVERVEKGALRVGGRTKDLLIYVADR